MKKFHYAASLTLIAILLILVVAMFVAHTGQAANINLSNKKLTAIPSSVFTNTDAKELNLSKNNLTGSLPGQIGQLQKLIKMDVSNNKLTGIPAEIGQLKNLNNLDFSNNQIGTMPNEISSLSSLSTLSLSNNLYKNFPIQLMNLSNLRNLDFSNNKISWLPTNIDQLKNLKKIVLTGNPIDRSEILRIKEVLPQTEVVF